MGLFDVIRYPISDYPTEDELNALPRLLFNRWIIQIGYQTPEAWSPGRIAWQLSIDSTRSSQPECVFERSKLLRKLIKEYDEPV